jgi:hypothetical protein
MIRAHRTRDPNGFIPESLAALEDALRQRLSQPFAYALALWPFR